MASIQAFAYQGIKQFTAKDAKEAKKEFTAVEVAEAARFQVNCTYKSLGSVIQIMKGAIDEETFSTNFLSDNNGDWCPIRSCPWHKSTSPDVRAGL
jgi:hypothetical protein